jgi:hypothetical protein
MSLICSPGAVRIFRRVVGIAILHGFAAQFSSAFRVYVPRTNPSQNITYAPFEPYENGFVGYYGDSHNYQRERVNEGAPFTNTQPNQVTQHQECHWYNDCNFFVSVRRGKDAAGLPSNGRATWWRQVLLPR